MIVNLKIILEKFLNLLNLNKILALSIYKLAKIFVMSKHKNFKFIIFQVITPSFKGLNNS